MINDAMLEKDLKFFDADEELVKFKEKMNDGKEAACMTVAKEK